MTKYLLMSMLVLDLYFKVAANLLIRVLELYKIKFPK